MYDREYQNQTLSFEASGGLMNSSLVMQDFETDSYWAIMTGNAIGGKLKGAPLVELPIGKKVKWKDWVAEHPKTLVLSVNGNEDARDAYWDYFRSQRGFRGSTAKDKRMKTKEPIFAFHYKGKSYAVKHKLIENGAVFDLAGQKVFLYRPNGAPMFRSTEAFLSKGEGFQKVDGQWRDLTSAAIFDVEALSFQGETVPEKLAGGFDTFWYNWSLNNPETIVLE